MGKQNIAADSKTHLRPIKDSSKVYDYDHLFKKLKTAPKSLTAKQKKELKAKAAKMFEQANPENENIPAAYTFLGQMMAHDISFEADGKNERTSNLDFDSLYIENQHVIERADNISLALWIKHLYDQINDYPELISQVADIGKKLSDNNTPNNNSMLKEALDSLSALENASILIKCDSWVQGKIVHLTSVISEARSKLAATLDACHDVHQRNVFFRNAGKTVEEGYPGCPEFWDDCGISPMTENNARCISDAFVITGRNSYNMEDLPRDENGEAVIADSRNDENTILSQLHLIFLKFHNRVVADLILNNPDKIRSEDCAFLKEEAKRLSGGISSMWW